MKIQYIIMIAALAVPLSFGPALAADEGRYQIVNIKRDVDDGKGMQTVNGTMMVDSDTGKTWILDEQRGRWIPVGFREAQPSSGVTILPKQ